MKTLFNFLQTVFLTTGAIIGAGFITGAELIGFFGVDKFYIPIIIATISTALILSVVFYVLKSSSTNGLSVERLLGGKKFYCIATCFSSLIFSASMLAGIDALFNTVFNLGGLQFGSVLAIILITVFSKYGVKGMERLNLIIMPIILIAVNVLIIKNQSLTLPKIQTITFSGAVKAVIYVLMNVFLCLPVMRETIKNKSKKTLTLVSISVAVIIGVQAFIILSAINLSGEQKNLDMPLYYALFNGKFSALYFSLTLSCALTSAFSAYYPLYVYAKAKSKGFGLIVCALTTLIIAKLGLSQIVKYAYPIVGGFGALLFVKCLFCIKNKTNADNNPNCLINGGKYVKKKEE